MLEERAESGPAAVYATILPRFTAVVVDMGVIAGFVVAMMVGADILTAEGRWFGIVFVVALVLYEPLLVSLTGGTIGHHARNLRVQREVDGGNLNIVVAFLRWCLKSFLGIVSFFFIVLTRRHQALHDIATRSIVTVKDSDQLRSGDFAEERAGPVGDSSVSDGRRIAVILGYAVLLSFLMMVMPLPMVSDACLLSEACTGEEDMLLTGMGIVWLLCLGLVTVLGWKGKLIGARGGRARPDVPPDIS